MSLTVLIFVNLSSQDAHIWAVEPEGASQFVARLAPGATLRHLSPPEQKWNIVASDSYELQADDKNRVYIIGAAGVYRVESVNALAADSGASPSDFDFPHQGGGGWP
jgi:hypothetical protein